MFPRGHVIQVLSMNEAKEYIEKLHRALFHHIHFNRIDRLVLRDIYFEFDIGGDLYTISLTTITRIAVKVRDNVSKDVSWYDIYNAIRYVLRVSKYIFRSLNALTKRVRNIFSINI